MSILIDRAAKLAVSANQGDDVNSAEFFRGVCNAMTSSGLNNDELEACLLLLLNRKFRDIE